MYTLFWRDTNASSLFKFKEAMEEVDKDNLTII